MADVLCGVYISLLLLLILFPSASHLWCVALLFVVVSIWLRQSNRIHTRTQIHTKFNRQRDRLVSVFVCVCVLDEIIYKSHNNKCRSVRRGRSEIHWQTHTLIYSIAGSAGGMSCLLLLLLLFFFQDQSVSNFRRNRKM